MYATGKLGVGAGMRISLAAIIAPSGGLGGVMVTFPRNGEVSLGAGGTAWTVKVLSSSCKV
jgi:hypothetical protein